MLGLNCKEVVARSSALIDGELPFWEALQLRLHMAVCKGCTAFVHQMRVTRSLTLAAGQATPDDDAALAAVLARLASEGRDAG